MRGMKRLMLRIYGVDTKDIADETRALDERIKRRERERHQVRRESKKDVDREVKARLGLTGEEEWLQSIGLGDGGDESA